MIAAAQSLNLTGLDIGQKMTTLGSTLSGFTGMAGTDTAAQSFAGAYDPAARSLLDAAKNLSDGFASVGLVLGASAQNHNDANAAAAHKPPPFIGGMPGQSKYEKPSSPNAAGDPAPGPWWWKLIVAYVQGKVWPNGHQDQLRNAAQAWDDFANSVVGTSYNPEAVYQALGKLRAQDAEDIGAGLMLASDAYEAMFTISSNAKTIAQACRDHAQSIDDAHSEIESAAAELIIETGAIMVIGWGLSLFTAGGSGAAATALSAGNLARIGANIARIITGFEGAAVATAGGAMRVAPAAAAVANTMSKAASLPITRIAATTAGANAARLSQQEQAELTRIANESDYKKYLDRKAAEGKPPRSYEDYLQARDRFRQIQEQGGDWEQAVGREKGLTPESGWEPQKYAPNGVKPTEEGARRWDFANFGKSEAIECKSGQVDMATFTKQLETDARMVNKENWQVTWQLKEALSPAQMTKLTELRAQTGGRFNYQIGFE
ncbi:hypothetical protein BST43_26210 [Mycobacteroides saopaulense]|uniref:Outer membrane channel protein CpnT-like N-terminal domain-containing protein n=1 Tax=Mycobacteroides saopaulense TaxID=1578165 RepID=A0A1X0II93_9MYCO|nr:hypothetical protein [Mycobacteroides saopaulense]ORB47265.1 hypothetical protein BST43_26210 [Mycobacteroides saopaulense]